MKTSELTGAALDYAVAIGVGLVADETPRYAGNIEYSFKPSTNWQDGGPIIEREGITIAPYSTHNGVIREWKAGRDWPMSHFPYYFGPTPLIAAMRCYVESKLGEEVQDGL
jgi:hypothetical protein